MNPGAGRRLLGFLALGRRAGFLALGFDAAGKLVARQEAQLVLLARDLSPKTAARVMRRAEGARVPCRVMEATLEEIWLALGKRTGVIAVKDPGFARAFLEKMDH